MSQMATEGQPADACRICRTPTRDSAFVCDVCLDRLTRALAETPWLAQELDTTLTGTRGVDYRRLGGAPASEPRLPIHNGASEARSNLQAVLVAWVKFCADENVRNQSHRHGIPDNTPAAMSRWLTWRVDGLSFLEIGVEAVNEITAAVAQGKRVIDRPADSWYAGPCDTCGTDLYAKAQSGQITCRGKVDDVACTQSYDIAARREWLLQSAEDRLANAATIARAVSWLGAAPLTGSRVRKWAERGRIMPHGHDGTSPLYRIGDAIDLLAGDTRRAG